MGPSFRGRALFTSGRLYTGAVTSYLPMARSSPNPRQALTQAQRLGIYREMCRMRAFEEQLTQWSRDGVLRGSLHLATGQEALPAGACLALRKEDRITMTYRGHGYALAKGCPLGPIMAEILGRTTGLGKGKGGKMHLVHLETGILGANGIVGAGVPIGAGGALEAWATGKDLVAMSVFGDGTLNQGCVHETLNIAALWKLPFIALCENNLYAEMTPLGRSTPVTSLTDRMSAYGIPAVQIDGNDPLAVYDAVAKATERARAGEGPSFIEAMTYRTCGHYQADSGSYRTREEVAEWEAKSPIARYGAWLKANKDADDKKLATLAAEAKAEVQKAAEFALAGPVPTAEDLRQDVFA